jgi:hypothetical protein
MPAGVWALSKQVSFCCSQWSRQLNLSGEGPQPFDQAAAISTVKTSTLRDTGMMVVPRPRGVQQVIASAQATSR